MDYFFELGLIILGIGVFLYLYRTKTFFILPNKRYEKVKWFEIAIVLVGWCFIFTGIAN